MKQYQKLLITIIAFTAMIAISSVFFGNSRFNLSEENQNHAYQESDHATNELPNCSNSSEYNFTYYRDVFLDLCNVTLEYYENLTGEHLEYANRHICAIWGYENGTYTEEQVRNMTDTNSPIVGFRTYITNPFDGKSMEAFSPRPTRMSLKRHDDVEFRLEFRLLMEEVLGEHVSRIDAYLNTPNKQRLYFNEVSDIWGLGHVSGDHYEGFIWGAGDVILDIYRSTYFRDVPAEFEIVIQWHKLVGFLYEDRVMTVKFDTTYEFDIDWSWFPFIFPIYSNPEPITIIDDDTTKPTIEITSSNFVNGNQLYDGSPYLSLSGYVSDSSGVTIPEFQANGKPKLWQSIQSGSNIHNFDVHLPNPKELGTYNASVACWDLDLDIGITDREFYNKTIYFDVVDDDTTGPIINVERILGDGTDANPGYWYVTASDPESGIVDIIVNIEGLGTGHGAGYYPVNAHPFIGKITVTTINNDKDRGSKDQETSTITVEDEIVLEDDDKTPPILFLSHSGGTGFDNSPGLWSVWADDPESGIGTIEVKIDGIQIGTSTGYYAVPSIPGTHTIIVTVYNADEDYPALIITDSERVTGSDSVNIMDDDPTPPYISISHSGGGTDYDPGIWTVNVFDTSGISQMLVYIDDVLVGTHNGNYLVPMSLGNHIIEVVAIDADSDRDGDSLISSLSNAILIIDDDITPPIIEITPIVYGTDGDPGYWMVNVYDPESGVDVIEAYIDDILVGTTIGNYFVPNTLGEHIIRVVAKNADFDMGLLDQERSETTHSICIIDDDVTPPIIEITPIVYGTDGDPGYWMVNVYDPESGVDVIEVYIDDILMGTTIGDYLVPNALGEHIIRVEAKNTDFDRGAMDQESNEATQCALIIDDDVSSPDLEIIYFGSGTDGDSGYWTVNAHDPESGIDLIEIFVDGILVGTANGDYLVPNALGEHLLWVIAANADLDRGFLDQERVELSHSVYITDDDFTSPFIEISYSGSGTDGDSGYWMVNAYDLESGLDTIEICIDDLLVGTTNGIYIVPNILGDHIIRVYVTNADMDRGPTDQQSYESSAMVTIVDDDTDSPIINNLQISEHIYYLTISFEAYDSSGISSITITFDGELQIFYEPTELETDFEYILPNEWISEIGTHEIILEVMDNDFDRDGDVLLTEITTFFEVSYDELKQYVLWDIEELREFIENSPNWWWSQKNSKETMINKIDKLWDCVNENDFLSAYNKLLHDIKPKLTGVKTNENEEFWGGGIFLNPWIVHPDIQFQFCIECNSILYNLIILHENEIQSSFLARISHLLLVQVGVSRIIMVLWSLALMGLICAKLL